jgi:hypothetical protein
MDSSAATSGSSVDIDAFVLLAKTRGVPDEALVALLRQNGWSDERVYRSLGGYYAELLGVSPPNRSGRREYARDAFYYLLNFITPFMWTIALGQLFFKFIDRLIPDVTTGGTHGGETYDIAWQLATLIVAAPVFAFVHARIARQLARRPDLYDSGVRKWLTYIAIVFSTVTVLGDGIIFLQCLLTGGLSLTFVLDCLVILVIGGGVSVYYLATLRAPQAANG